MDESLSTDKAPRNRLDYNGDTCHSGESASSVRLSPQAEPMTTMSLGRMRVPGKPASPESMRAHTDPTTPSPPVRMRAPGLSASLVRMRASGNATYPESMRVIADVTTFTLPVRLRYPGELPSPLVTRACNEAAATRARGEPKPPAHLPTQPETVPPAFPVRARRLRIRAQPTSPASPVRLRAPGGSSSSVRMRTVCSPQLWWRLLLLVLIHTTQPAAGEDGDSNSGADPGESHNSRG